MMETAPAAPFKMAEPDLLLELLIIALDAPAQFGEIDQTGEANVVRQVESQYFVGSFSPLGHSIRAILPAMVRCDRSRAVRCELRRRAKRDLSGTFVPSRQVIVRQALAGRLKARSLTLTG